MQYLHLAGKKHMSDKLKKVKWLLISLAENTCKNEEHCVKYSIYEQRNADTESPEVVLIEEWISLEALDRHRRQPYLMQYYKILEIEALVVKPELTKVVDQVWGFAERT